MGRGERHNAKREEPMPNEEAPGGKNKNGGSSGTSGASATAFPAPHFCDAAETDKHGPATSTRKQEEGGGEEAKQKKKKRDGS